MTAARWLEDPLSFGCDDETLIGVLARPALATRVGVVIVVGGPQTHVGSHRQFVLLSRHLAAGGVPCLRFDVRGMGDSTGAPRSFDALDEDVAAAIGALRSRLPSVERVVLWGLCDGASAALMYWHRTRDPRVCGFVLLNPWVRSATTLAKAHVKHYYLQRLTQPAFWKKLLKGGVAGRALTDLASNLKLARATAPAGGADGRADFQQQMLDAASLFTGPMALILSGNDYTAREFEAHSRMVPAWQTVLSRPQVVRCNVADADHTFSTASHQTEMESFTLQWVRRLTIDQRVP